jgi:predicted negative regulator of RcsB-dependent stress response
MKKVVKKQLKEDEFVSTMTKIVRFFEEHTKKILIGVAVVAGLALLFAGARFLQVQRARKESRVLSQLIELRSTAAAKPENLAALEKLAGNGKYARLGYVQTATYWVEKGDLQKAAESLARVKLSPRDFIYYQAQDLLAQINVLKKDYDQAIAIYTKIEQAKPKEYVLDAVLFHKAEALEAKGSKPEALALYKKIQEDFPQSYYGYDAAQRVRKLEPAASSVPSSPAL